MKYYSTGLFLVFSVFLGLSAMAGTHEANYDLNGTSTFLWDTDVDYFAPPILINRISKTFQLHQLEFNISRYISECVSYERVCVAYDQKGNCVSWENRCVQWDQREVQVEKRIELHFRGLPDLADKEQETYEISIDRMKPIGDGEDDVSTWLKDVKTKVPVKIMKIDDFSYSIEPK